MKKTFFVLTFVLILVLALSAFAPIGSAASYQLQATTTGSTDVPGNLSFSGPNPYLLSNIVGLDLRGRRSAVFGEVNGFVVDPLTGRVMYVVASTSGPQGSAIQRGGIGVTGATSAPTTMATDGAGATSAATTDATSMATSGATSGTPGAGGTVAPAVLSGEPGLSQATTAPTTGAGTATGTTSVTAAATGTTDTSATSVATGTAVATGTSLATATTDTSGTTGTTDAGAATGTTGAGVGVTGGDTQAQADNYVLLPWGGVELNANAQPDDDPNTPVGARAFYLGMSQLAVSRAPQFDLASLDDLANANWDQSQRAYWGGVGIPVTGGTFGEGQQGQAGQQMLSGPLFIDSVSKLSVTGPNGDNIGTVQDIIFQPKVGQMMYVVLQRTDGSLVPVPWTALDWRGTTTTAGGTSGAGAVGTSTPETTGGTVVPTSAAGSPVTTTPGAAAGAPGSTASGLGIGNTYTVALTDDANASLASAPTWSSMSEFDPYNASWENSIASYWGMITFNSRNKGGVSLSSATPEVISSPTNAGFTANTPAVISSPTP